MPGEIVPDVPTKEYLLIEGWPVQDTAEVQRRMTEYGKQGWVFVHADLYYHHPDKLRVWFMR